MCDSFQAGNGNCDAAVMQLSWKDWVWQERLVGVGWFKLKELNALTSVNLVTKECCPTPHCTVLVKN